MCQYPPWFLVFPRVVSFPLIRPSMSPARFFWNSTLIIVLSRQERKQVLLLGGDPLPCGGEASVASFSAGEVGVLPRKCGPLLPAQRVIIYLARKERGCGGEARRRKTGRCKGQKLLK